MRSELFQKNVYHSQTMYVLEMLKSHISVQISSDFPKWTDLIIYADILIILITFFFGLIKFLNSNSDFFTFFTNVSTIAPFVCKLQQRNAPCFIASSKIGYSLEKFIFLMQYLKVKITMHSIHLILNSNLHSLSFIN